MPARAGAGATQPAGLGPLLRIRVCARGSRVSVRLVGQIDMSNAARIVAAVADFHWPAARVTLDLGGVTFLGAAGISALLRLRSLLESAGGDLIVTGAHHRPVRLPLATCRLDHLFRNQDGEWED